MNKRYAKPTDEDAFDVPTEREYKFKPVYTSADLTGLDYLDTKPGEYPFLRGPYATMYTQHPWTIRQYAGFGSAQTTNKLYRDAISKGAKGLSIAFDLPTHLGWDSDSPNASGDVGKAGVAIDSVEDMKELLVGIPLNEISVSMTMNGAALPIMASFIVASEELGYNVSELSGTIQNDILKEFMVRNTYIFSPESSLRISADIVEYNAKHLPKFNSMSISGYHFQEAGADPILELALTLSNARTYVEYAASKGWDIDNFCEHLTFFFCVGSNFYLEIAKLRAARVLWAEMLDEIGVKSAKAKMLRMHCQTSGWSLVAGDPLNNIARTTSQAIAAVFGGTQSLHTNSYDEAYSLPTDESAKVARDTQVILQNETGICDVVDPWAGSYMMEKITHDVQTEVKKLFNQIEAKGGMLKALRDRWIQELIQTRSAKTQAQIDSGLKPIVGLSSKSKFESRLNFDSGEIREQQSLKLLQLKGHRNSLAVRRSMKHLTEVAESGNGNLLEATVLAVRSRATIQECTDALTKAFPRHQQQPLLVKNTYGNHSTGNVSWALSIGAVKEAIKFLGRKPRILITKIGQDGHDRGANIISSILNDVGCEAHQSPLFNSIEKIVQTAIELNVDIIAVSSLANAHNELIPKLMYELHNKEVKVPVILGGIVPTEDHDSLREYGIAHVMEPGVSIQHAIPLIMNIVNKSNLKLSVS